MSWPPEYLDYPVEPPDPHDRGHPRSPSLDYQDHTVVMPFRDHWRGLWAGEFETLGEYEGSREEVIAWARRCSDRCYLFDQSAGDLVYIESWTDQPG